MEISGDYLVPGRREAVWQALNDPDVLGRAIPGCEQIEQDGADRMRAKITAAIGPVRARFDTTLSIRDAEPPARYTLAGEAKAGASGFGRGEARVELAEEGDDTRLSYQAEFKVGGRLAQVGSRLVAGATRKTADEFFANLARELGADTDAAQAAGDRGERPRAGHLPWLLAAGILLVAAVLWMLLG